MTPYLIEESTQALDVYSYKTNYCFVGKTTFYRQICPGFEIGNDAYPILKFATATHLEIGEVQDITVGASTSSINNPLAIAFYLA